MDSNDTPRAAPLTTVATEQLRALLELKAQMERLHAELEYARLMLSLQVRRF